MQLHEALCCFGIPFDDEHSSGAGGIETVAPATGPVNGQRALMVAAVNVAVGAHVFTALDGVAQFRLPGQFDAPAPSGVDGEHLTLPIP
jgi:hypothetical protein